MSFENLLQKFATENVHENTFDLMIHQLIKAKVFNGMNLPPTNFCIARLLTEPAFDIKLTNEQAEKLLHIFTVEQMLVINDKLHNGVTWF